MSRELLLAPDGRVVGRCVDPPRVLDLPYLPRMGSVLPMLGYGEAASPEGTGSRTYDLRRLTPTRAIYEGRLP